MSFNVFFFNKHLLTFAENQEQKEWRGRSSPSLCLIYNQIGSFCNLAKIYDLLTMVNTCFKSKVLGRKLHALLTEGKFMGKPNISTTISTVKLSGKKMNPEKSWYLKTRMKMKPWQMMMTMKTTDG